MTATIASPTFILMAEYAGRLPLFHLDLYRVQDAMEALEDGLLDEREGTGVAIVEWADRLGAALPERHLAVHLEVIGEDDRSITLAAHGDTYQRYLAVEP